MDRFEKETHCSEDLLPLALAQLALDTRHVHLRACETNFGNLVADALRFDFQTNFGLINGGFIRGDQRMYI